MRATKALSVSRPWTHLILEGHKPVENRTWRTDYRGYMIIHGAKSWQGEDAAALAETILAGSMIAFTELRLFKELFPTGYLGVVDLIDVCEQDCWTGDKSGCGPWAMPGCYHWRLATPTRFPAPIPGNGRLGLFIPPIDVQRAVTQLKVAA